MMRTETAAHSPPSLTLAGSSARHPTPVETQIRREATSGSAVKIPASATTDNRQVATGSRFAASDAGQRSFTSFVGRLTERDWRPKTMIRNSEYPRVSSPGCYFKSDSGGFALIHRATNKWLGHFTKSAIAKLEKQYGKKKSRATNRKRK